MDLLAVGLLVAAVMLLWSLGGALAGGLALTSDFERREMGWSWEKAKRVFRISLFGIVLSLLAMIIIISRLPSPP